MKDHMCPTYEEIEEIIKREGHVVIKTQSDSKTSPVELAYTVGMSKKGTSDFMMMGFKSDMMHGLLNDVVRELDRGSIIRKPRRLSKILKGYDVMLSPIPDLDAARFAYVLNKYSKGADLNLVQVFLPDPQGLFPDDEGCAYEFVRMQDHLRLIPNS